MSSHPSLWNLFIPTLESTFQVVGVCLTGALLARAGGLPKSSQKILSSVNISIFTPCLVFSKLASSLSLETMADLWALPLVFVVLTFVSWAVSKCGVYITNRFFSRNAASKLRPREQRFVKACCIFQNSNSLPIALVTSLAGTLEGLYWDKLQVDTREAITSRGILYLIIFQQMGLIIRWSYGFNYLLTSQPGDDVDESVSTTADAQGDDVRTSDVTPLLKNHHHARVLTGSSSSEDDALLYSSSNATVTPTSPTSCFPSSPTNADVLSSFPPHMASESDHPTTNTSAPLSKRLFRFLHTFYLGFRDFMNPPLWAMLAAVLVASIGPLQDLFFDEASFVAKSFTVAIASLGDVAVPLILVVLGANLASAPPLAEDSNMYARKREHKTIWLALSTRMLLVPLIICPLTLPLAIWGVNVGVLGDPIFMVVLWLLVGSPTAITLTQICQLNNFCEREMAAVLWYGYCVFSIPSTMALVILSEFCDVFPYFGILMV